MPDQVICLGTETGHSCVYLFILISFILCQLDIFAFGCNIFIYTCLYGSLAYSVIYFRALLSSKEPGLSYFTYIFTDYISIKRPFSNLAVLLG